MSGLELVAVVGCVAAVISAYNDGSELVRKVRARRRARRALQHSASPDTSTQDLEMSLANGQDAVQREYDRHYRRAGDIFATGDQEACDILKNIIIHLQGQVIMNLKVAWQENTNVDALTLQDVSDESQDRAILCLIQLHQRLMVAAPITEAKYSPPLPISKYNQHLNETRSPPRVESWSTQSSMAGPSRSPTSISLDVEKKSGRLSGIFRKQKTITEDFQPRTTEYPQEAPRHRPPPVPLKDARQNANLVMGFGREPPTQEELLLNRSSVSSMSDRHSSIAEAEPPESDPFYDPWKGAPSPRANVQERQLFNRSNRVPLPEPETFSGHRVSIGPDIIPEHGTALGHRSSQSSSHSWMSRLSRDTTSSHPTSQASNHSWRRSTISEPASNHRLSQISVGQALIMSQQGPPIARRTTMPTGLSNGFLPTEDNDFAGFCKGAWRLQIGEKKKAIEEIKRPGSMFAMSSFWKCQRCHFEGRMIKDANGKKSVDTRVYGASGILYRWEFLFKCHVHLKDALPNTMDSTFGCIFCCAEGKSTPIFGGIKAFLAHMQEHRATPPEGEVLYRMSCVIGRIPSHEEAFDIALPAV